MTLDLKSNRPAGTPSMAQVISFGELHGEHVHRTQAAPILESPNPLHAVRVELQVCVGTAELTVGELLAMHEHQVLVLDTPIDSAVDLRLDGKVVARGQLVAVDGNFALRIVDVPVPLRA